MNVLRCSTVTQSIKRKGLHKVWPLLHNEALELIYKLTPLPWFKSFFPFALLLKVAQKCQGHPTTHIENLWYYQCANLSLKSFLLKYLKVEFVLHSNSIEYQIWISWWHFIKLNFYSWEQNK